MAAEHWTRSPLPPNKDNADIKATRGDRRKPLEEQASKNTQEQEVKAPEERRSRVKQEAGCQDSQMCVCVLYMLPHYTIDKTFISWLLHVY